MSQGDNGNSDFVMSLRTSRMTLMDDKSLETGLGLHLASRTGKLWPMLVIADAAWDG